MIPLRRTRLRGFSRVFPKGITMEISQLRALSGSTPCEVNKKSDQPKPVALACFGGPSGGQPAAQAAAAALRALRAALANAHAFPQLRALSGSNPCTGNKKAAGIRQSLFYSMVGRQGFEPWTLGLKVPCSAS